MANALASAAPATPGFFDRERTIAKPGFNRWLVPPAALAIHLCIGMAYGFSVFWLPLSQGNRHHTAGRLPEGHGLLRPDVRDHLRLEDFDAGLDVHPVLRFPRLLCCALGRLAGTRRSAQGRCRGGILLVRRPGDFCVGRLPAPDLDAVAGFGRDRRHRSRPRLHLAGIDADQMVPGPSRHGDRHGDHGLRRRRHDRRPAGQQADEVFCHADLGRRHGKPSSRWPRSISCS